MEQCAQCGAYLMTGDKSCYQCKAPVVDPATAAGKRSPGGKDKKADANGPAKKFGDAKVSDNTNILLQQQEQQADLIVRGLANLYLSHIRPLEEQSRFETFASPSFNRQYFFTAPQVLIIGAYSSGKSSFIQYLAERSIPGVEVGEQPTTATVHAIMGLKPGTSEGIILGNAAASDTQLPFQNLQSLGSTFLNHFQVSLCDSPLLQKLTFIDTPGVLAGATIKHRDYHFPDVVKQLCANSVSMVLVIFDAHKLDISDTMKDALLALRGYEDKVFFVLNKADTLSSQSLLRVYGALMWSLGKIFDMPEAIRVFIGSFWEKPYQSDENKSLLEAEEASLLAQIRGLPKVHSIRLVNEIVKRARQVKTHVLICNQLRSHFGVFTSKDKKKAELLKEERLIEEFNKVMTEHGLPIGDMPRMNHFIAKMNHLQIHKIPEISKSQLQKLDWVLSTAIPDLMRQSQEMQFKIQQIEQEKLNEERNAKLAAKQLAASNPEAASGPVNNDDGDGDDSFNPFANDDDGNNMRDTVKPWSIPPTFRIRFTEQFTTLKLNNGRLSGQSAKPILQLSGLTGQQLKKIWFNADIDKDGYLDSDEFILCQYLIEVCKSTGSVPPMTVDLCPPSKRTEWQGSQ